MRSGLLQRGAVAVGLVVGAPTVAYSFRYAAAGRPGQIGFHLFWAGFLAAAVPATWRAVARRTPDNERWLLIAGLGVWGFVPKLLRNPGGPLFADELAHWRSAVDVASTGSLHVHNTLLPILERFPGLHGLIAALRVSSGISTWQAGEATLLVLHVATLMAITLLVTRLCGSVRVGALAAVVYALNPGAMFFDAQFSYESYGIVFFLWTITAAVSFTRPGCTTRTRAGWLIVGLVTAGASVVTHHLSSYILVFTLVLMALAHVLLRKRTKSTEAGTAPLLALTAFATTAAAAWLIFPAGGITVDYYSPYVTGAYREAIRLISDPGAGRQLFLNSVAPAYERASAYLGPVILSSFVLYALRKFRLELSRMPAAFVAIAAMGTMYFASLPIILTRFGNEGARRSWSFSYLGIAMFSAWALDALSTGGDRRSTRFRRLASAGCGVALAVLLIGNTTSAISVEYRFPGAYVYGSDSRSLTSELVAATRWFRQRFARGNGIITDRYSGLAFGGIGGNEIAHASPGFKFWELFFDSGPPPARLLEQIAGSPYQFVVVDEQMTKHLPRIGVYFSGSEPKAFNHGGPPPARALKRFTQVSWATEIYRSDHYAIYRLDPIGLANAAAELGS